MADANAGAASSDPLIHHYIYDEEGRLLQMYEENASVSTVIHYDHASLDDEADPPATAASPCPDCRGKGTILLLISATPCPRCGGSGSC